MQTKVVVEGLGAGVELVAAVEARVLVRTAFPCSWSTVVVGRVRPNSGNRRRAKEREHASCHFIY